MASGTCTVQFHFTKFKAKNNVMTLYMTLYNHDIVHDIVQCHVHDIVLYLGLTGALASKGLVRSRGPRREYLRDG